MEPQLSEEVHFNEVQTFELNEKIQHRNANNVKSLETVDGRETVNESKLEYASNRSGSESDADDYSTRVPRRYFHTPPYNADDAQDTIINLQTQVGLLAKERQENQTELKKAQNELQRLQSDKLHLAIVNDKASSSESRLCDNIIQLEIQLKAANSEIFIRSCELETFKSQLATLRKLNLDLQGQLTSAHSTIKELTFQKNSQKLPVDDRKCDVLMQEIKLLQFQLSQRSKNANSCPGGVESSHNIEESLDTEKRAEATRRKLQDEIKCLESSSRILSEKMKKYKKDAIILREDYRHLEKKYEYLKEETVELTRYLGTGNDINVFKRCKNLLSGYEGRIEQLESVRDEALRREEELHTRIKILENKLSDEKRGRLQLMQRVRKQQDDLDNLEGECTRLKRDLGPELCKRD